MDCISYSRNNDDIVFRLSSGDEITIRFSIEDLSYHIYNYIANNRIPKNDNGLDLLKFYIAYNIGDILDISIDCVKN